MATTGEDDPLSAVLYAIKSIQSDANGEMDFNEAATILSTMLSGKHPNMVHLPYRWHTPHNDRVISMLVRILDSALSANAAVDGRLVQRSDGGHGWDPLPRSN